MAGLTLSAPAPLTAEHRLDDFACGVDSFDDWLKRRARPNRISEVPRTYVVAEGDKVVGYYCLAPGALASNDAPAPVHRNMTDPVSIAALGRLAIDKSCQGRGLGVALLQDAVLRTIHASDILGIRGLLVHALSGEAKAFYQHHGFVASPSQPMTLILSLKKNVSEHNNNDAGY